LQRPVLLLLAVLTTLPLCARDFEVRPAPPWVETLTVDLVKPIARANVRWGIYDLLIDHQVRAGEASQVRYFRTVRRVLSPSGVQNASELSLDFDPSFERLTIHEISVIRDGRRIDVLEPDDIRVIEKEDESESGIYDGRRTALVFMRDVRPGDTLDYSWSLSGRNPILQGRYTEDYDLSSTIPTRRIRHRLLWPAGRPLEWRGADPAIQTAGALQTFVWEAIDVPPLDVEDETPPWYEPWTTVSVSEFASWHEVADWGVALFRLDDRSKREIRELAAKITREHATREERLTAAVRFVQDEIRYLGIEMGRNSHEPHQPWETLDQRWGDCKDKTLLLVGLMRELGLDAAPALVSTRLGKHLDRKLPSPFLFDHVIAQVVDAGRTYWIDGTIADQGGTFSTTETPNDGLALLVRDGTHELTPIVTPARGSILVEQTYRTRAWSTPVELRVTTTWSGHEADAMRADLAAQSIEDFAERRLNELAIDQPRIEALAAPAIHDDREKNLIVVTESYRIGSLWQDGDWTWYPRTLESFLGRPETMIRSMPLSVPWPLHVEQRASFEFPEDVDVPRRRTVTENAALRWESVVDSNGRNVSIRQSLVSKSDAVDVAAVADHLTKLGEIWSGLGFRLAPAGAQPKAARASAASLPPQARWMGVMLLVAMAAFGTAWAVGRRLPGPQEHPHDPQPDGDRTTRTVDRPDGSPFAPGEAAASAIVVGGADEIAVRLGRMRCPCGEPLPTAADLQRARFGDRELTIALRRCAACGRESSVYFQVA
jgi:transglutaminase-like putative cysteine protease